MIHSSHHVEGSARRSAFAIIAILSLVAALLTITVPAFGYHPSSAVTPTVEEGNPDCGELGFGDGFKASAVGGGDLEDDDDGTYGDGTIEVEITVNPTPTDESPSGNLFDWELLTEGYVIDAVFSKGGNQGGNLYDYTGLAQTSDVNLHSPQNTGGEQNLAGLSHIWFCYSEAPEETATPSATATPTGTPVVTATPTPTTAPTATAAPTASPAGTVAAATGTPRPAGTVAAATGVPNTALDGAPSSTPLIVILGALLAISAGGMALAFANRRHRR